MTVCIAALCNIGPNRPAAIIAASDRMITIDEIEYEPNQTKVLPLATQTIALLAGDMSVHAAILPIVTRSLIGTPPGITVESIAEKAAEEFAIYRRKKAEQTILAPIGLTTETFLSFQKDMSPDLVIELTNKLLNNSLNSLLIIAGVDQYGGHIYKISDPGVAVDFGIPCFAAIGMGQPHAESQLMLARFDKQWPVADTLFQVFSAKIRAEAAAGVGDKTDITIVTSGGYVQATDEEIGYLRDIFDRKESRDDRSRKQAYAKTQIYLQERAAARQPAPVPQVAQTAIEDSNEPSSSCESDQ